MSDVIDQLYEHEKQRLRYEIQRLKECNADLLSRNHGLLSALQTAESDRQKLRDALEQERNGKRPPRLPDGVRPALRVVSGGES